MIRCWKTILFLFSAVCLVQFSVGDSASNEVYEKERHKLEIPESDEDEREELLSAIHKGDTEVALKLIKAGALEEYYHGIYAIHEKQNLEKIRNKLEVVSLLLRLGIAVVPEDDYLADNTLEEGFFNITLVPETDLVITLRASLPIIKSWNNESLIQSGKIPLFIFCALPDVSRETVKLVLDTGNVDIDVQDRNNLTAVMIASARGNLDVVKFLVENGANVNNTAFMEFNSDGRFGLHYDFIKIFTGKDVTVPPTILHSSALVAAVYENHPDILEYLLKVGADIDVKGQSWMALSNPTFYGKIEIVEILLKNGIDVNSKDVMGATALHKVAERGHTEIAKLLLNYGANANAIDNFGWTPLHVAALFSRNATKAMIELLLDSGSDVNAITDGGFSPLNLAEAGNNRRFLGYLIGKYDILNSTAEHRGLEEIDSDEEHIEIMSMLLHRGADLNHQDDVLGWTALHWATASGDLRVTHLLIEKYGAVMTSSKMGMTPFGTAIHFGRKGVFEFFKSYLNLV